MHRRRSNKANDGTASSSAKATPVHGGSSGFSKMHLSALFQRRQDRNGGGGGARAASAESPERSAVDKSSTETREAHDAQDQASKLERSWSQPVHLPSNGFPPPSNSARWNRRGSSATIGSVSRVRRMSSGLASLFSPRPNAADAEPDIDPLIIEIFENPEDVAAFDEALRDDAGQQEPHVASSLWPAASALKSLGLASGGGEGTGADGEGGASNREQQDDLAATPADEEGGADQKLLGRQVNVPRSSMTQVSHPRKVGRIAAASDFAPIYERTQPKDARRVNNAAAREGLLYNVVRYPLLLFIFLVIATEFTAYVVTRQLVNLTEYTIAWRGHKGTLRKRLRKAESYEEWRDVALELDSYLGYEAWKCDDASGLYDWILIKKVLHSLQQMRKQDDVEGVMSVLELCLRNNFAGIENFRLYSETFFGTKYLIENYLSEVEEALAFVSASNAVSAEAKRAFYRSTQKNMGRSALCLSGGGAFGYYHVGVVRALLDANLLPNIITGTSAGGLIAALACTRTDDELRRLLVPELADRITACEEPFSVWGLRVWRTGARFDLIKWAEKAQFFTRGSMTFAEAYARTGKTLNISVIPSDRHSPVKLLNHHTAPNCIIWSSLLASAAVPGLLKPVCLMQKTRSGRAVPWNWGHRFKDGSLRVDIPLQDLHSLFNVTYPIVSQVNPHVHLFFFAPKGMPGRPVAHRKGKGWRGGFLLSASEHVLKLNLSMNFKIIRDLDLLPSLLGQDWSSVFLQRFSGAVTIWPKTRAWDWVRILSDPDRKELYRMMCVGSGVTFPKLHMVENRVRIERAIENGRRANRRVLRAEQKAAVAGATLSAAGTSVEGHSANAGDSGPEGRVDTPLGGGGAMTQSDTDGEFFAGDESGDGASGKHGGKGGVGATKLDRLRRQLNGGFSRADKANESSHARDATLTPLSVGGPGSYAQGASTPGELPRHIRVRSMGLDDDDADVALSNDVASAAGGYDGKYDELDAHLLRRRMKRNGEGVTVQGGGGGGKGVSHVAFPTSKLSQQHHASGDGIHARSNDDDWRKRGSVRDDYSMPEDVDRTVQGGARSGGRQSVSSGSSSSSSSGVEDS